MCQSVIRYMLNIYVSLSWGTCTCKIYVSVILFVFCLLFWVYRPTWEFFTHREKSPVPVKGYKFFTYAWYSWPLNSEGSLVCHTYCDTGHPFIWSSPRSRDTHKCCWAFGSWIVNTCFNDLGMSQTRFEHPKFHMWGKHLTDCTTAAARIFVRDALIQTCHSMTEY